MTGVFKGRHRVSRVVALVAALVVLALFGACSQAATTGDSPTLDQPVTIYMQDGTRGMESYQASVKTYASNNRSTAPQRLRESYRLSLKVVDGTLRTRIDYDAAAMPDMVARSIISDGSTTLVVKTASNEVEQRIALPAEQKRLALMNDSLALMGRVDLSSVSAIARRLSLDVSDATPGQLVLNVPPATLPALADNAAITAYRISFDSTESAMLETEMVIAESDGATRTIKTQPIYQEYGEDLIKVGELTTTVYDSSVVLDTSDSAAATYASADDIPSISAEELAALQADGAVADAPSDARLGDPASADYTETQLTVYEDVKLNTLADSMFRMDF